MSSTWNADNQGKHLLLKKQEGADEVRAQMSLNWCDSERRAQALLHGQEGADDMVELSIVAGSLGKGEKRTWSKPPAVGPASQDLQSRANSIVNRSRGSIVPTKENPFSNLAPWTRYEIFKAILLGPTLLPLRVFLLAICGLLSAVLVFIATCGAEGLQEEEGCYYSPWPLPLWRCMLLQPIRLLNRCALWSFGFWRVRIIDRRSKKSESMPNILVVAPHLTPVDQFIVAWVFPPLPCFVGDSRIVKNPGMRRVGIASQSIFVDLSRKTSREFCRRCIASRASRGTNFPATLIFPEGRVTNGRVLIQFKLGPFAPGQPVLPILLRYPHRYFDPSWVGRNRTPWWGLRMLLQFSNHCHIEILEVYNPSAEEQANPDFFARNVRAVMANKLGLCTTEHTYDDAFLYQEALQSNVDNDFEVKEMTSMLNVDLDKLTEWLHKFRKMDKDGDGLLSREEFSKIIQEVDHSMINRIQTHKASRRSRFTAFLNNRRRMDSSINRLFCFFDTDGSGSISYREFVQGVALLSGKCSAASRAKLAFLIYDVTGQGELDRRTLRQIIDSSVATNLNKTKSSSFSSIPSDGNPRTTGNDVAFQKSYSDSSRSARASVGMQLLDDSSPTINYRTFCSIIESNPELVDLAFKDMQIQFDPVA